MRERIKLLVRALLLLFYKLLMEKDEIVLLCKTPNMGEKLIIEVTRREGVK